MKTVIVIPTYNEAENIETLLTQIFSQEIDSLHVVIVDDSSPDGTADRARVHSMAASVTVLERKEKSGLGSAYRDGFRHALELGAEYIIQMDADFSHDPHDLQALLSRCKEDGVDLTLGSRRVKGGSISGWGIVRNSMSWGAMTFARLLLSLKTRDVTTGFRCFRRKVLEAIDLSKIHSSGYAFQEEMLYLTEKKGFSVCEIPIHFQDRTRGKSKLSKQDIWEFFVVMVTLKFFSR